MPVTIKEHRDSPKVTDGENPTAERTYNIIGAESFSDAMIALLIEAEATYDVYGDGSVILKRGERSIQPNGDDDVWLGTVQYAKTQKQPKPLQPETGSPLTSFSTGGGTEKRYTFIGTESNYGISPYLSEDFKGAINATRDGVQGVDVPSSNFRWTEQWVFDSGSMTPDQIIAFEYVTASINDAPFRLYADSEVLCRNISADQRADGTWLVKFEFELSRNDDNIEIAGTSGIEKRGWDYLWVNFTEAQGDKQVIRRPKSAHVGAVLYYTDFSLLGIGT